MLLLLVALMVVGSYTLESVLIPSNTYNISFINSYLDAGQSPRDAFGIIVDYYHNQDANAVQYSSSDLPPYYALFKVPDDNAECGYYYHFMFTEYPFLRDHNLYAGEFAYNLTYPKSEDGIVPTSQKMLLADFTEGGLTLFYNKIYLVDGVAGEVTGNNNKQVTLISSNFDIYGTSLYNGGQLVFQQPTLRKATTLAPVIQREKTKGTLQVVLKEIIQILPLILVVVVSLVGLRKVLKMLLEVLRRS